MAERNGIKQPTALSPLTIEIQEVSGPTQSPIPKRKGICSGTLFFAERVKWDEDVLHKTSEE